MSVFRTRWMMGFLLAVVASVAVAACGSSGSTSSSGATTASSGSSTLRIAYDPNPTNTSIVVAQDQGFFKKNGLNVTLTTSAATSALLPSIGKQFDLIGSGPSAILQFASHGYKPILVSSQTIENGGSLRNTYLVGAKGITSVSDLKGKTIGAAVESGTQYDALLYLLKQQGISQSQVKFLQVPFADMENDLQSGTIQAALTINPFAGVILGAGYKDLGDPISESVKNQNAMSIGWVGYKPWVETHAKIIKEFNAAQNEALAWMKTHNKAAQQILVKDFQLPAAAAAHYPITQYVSFAPKVSYLQQWVAPLKAVGALPASYDTPSSSLVYTP